MYPLPILARFATPHRCFDHVVAAIPGMVVAVPEIMISGCLKNLPLVCPVPWHEIWSVLDVETDTPAGFDADLFVPPLLLSLGIAERSFLSAPLPEYAATVFSLPDGLRLGISNDYVHKVVQL